MAGGTDVRRTTVRGGRLLHRTRVELERSPNHTTSKVRHCLCCTFAHQHVSFLFASLLALPWQNSMRSSQAASASHPSARSCQQPSAAPRADPPFSSTAPDSSQPSPFPPPSFTSSIAPLHDLFTYSHPSASSSTAATSPFVLALRVQPDCLILTATDLSTLYQARITERLFDDKCRRLNFGAGADRYSGLCDLLRQCMQSNTDAQPRVTHAVSGVRGSDCSNAVMELTFTLRVGSGSGLDVECSWQLPSLLRRIRQTEPTEERKEQASDNPKRKKRRVPAEDDLDSLDFPDLPDELLASTSHSHASSSTVASHSTADDEYVYSREVALIVHRLLDLHLAGPSASAASASSGNSQTTASLELTQLKEQVRLLEQQVSTQTERAERVERELRSSGNGGGEGNGVGIRHDVADKCKPRQMSDRSVVNPGVRRRKARGIHIEG